jgi:hypothetical protein
MVIQMHFENNLQSDYYAGYFSSQWLLRVEE